MKERVISLLKWSEKYTKTDMLYLFGGGFWLVSGQVISAGLTLLLATVFANYVSADAFGTYRYVLSIAGMIGIFALPGLNTAFTKACVENNEGIIKKMLATKIAWGLIGSIISLFISLYYYLNGNILLSFSFMLVALFVPFVDSFSLFQSFLQGKKQFDVSFKYSVVSHIAVTLTLISVAFRFDSALILLFTYLASWTITRLLFYRIVNKNITKKQNNAEATISYGKHLSAMGIIGTVAAHIDKLLVFHYLGVTELAIYLFAIAIPEQIKGLLKNVFPLTLPRFVNQTETYVKKNMFKNMVKMFTLVMLIVLFYILVAPYIYEILFPKYSESIIYSQIMSLSLLGAIATLPISALQSHSRVKKLYKMNTATSILQIGLLFILITNFGIMGAIIARISARIIGLVLATYFVMK